MAAFQLHQDQRIVSAAALISILAVLGTVLWRALLPRPIPGIPYNVEAAGRVSGDIPDMKRASGVRFWMLDQFTKHNSPVVQIFADPFKKPRVIVSDFRETHDVLTHRTAEFDKSNLTSESFGGVVGASIISMKTTDSRFKHNKELLKDLMSPSFLNEVSAPTIYENVVSLLDLWRIKAKIEDGEPFKADQDLHHLALDIIVSAAVVFPLDRTTIRRQIEKLSNHPRAYAAKPEDNQTPLPFENVVLDPQLAACVYLSQSIGVPFQSVFPRLAHWIYLQKPESKQAFRLKEKLISENIDDAVKRLERCNTGGQVKKLSAIDQLILREKKTAEKFGDLPDFHRREIYDELFGYIVGGHDTTSVTMAWWVKFMARYQQSQSTLREALYGAFPDALGGGRLPSVTEITRSNIPYLDAIIEETHRSAHIVPTVVRQTTIDTVLLGYRIPKNTHIYFYTSGASFMQPAFEVSEGTRSGSARNDKARFGKWDSFDVSDFVPERWLKLKRNLEDGSEKQIFDQCAGPQLAFGSGLRGCFGRRLAYLEMRIMIVLLVWSFEFQELDEKLNNFEGIDFFAVPPKDCYIKLRKNSL